LSRGTRAGARTGQYVFGNPALANNKVTAAMETYLLNRSLTGRELPSALRPATERADESRQGMSTALPDVSALSIAPEALCLQESLPAPSATPLHSLRPLRWPVWPRSSASRVWSRYFPVLR
jgi:hypothetical protein